ncbi:hypothetical protein GYH30_010995 [Glycine max]|uniref:Uncharacterized protein n=1 Tax=Glycine max TaxID=3847 RepID=A0A0R0KC93_SOYBN|nr:hypothetical protein GYH30_010995 [Glycine max]
MNFQNLYIDLNQPTLLLTKCYNSVTHSRAFNVVGKKNLLPNDATKYLCSYLQRTETNITGTSKASEQADSKIVQPHGTPVSIASAFASLSSRAMVKPIGNNFNIAWQWNSLKGINNRKVDINHRKVFTGDFCGKTMVVLHEQRDIKRE